VIDFLNYPLTLRRPYDRTSLEARHAVIHQPISRSMTDPIDSPTVLNAAVRAAESGFLLRFTTST
jgi:hypothetical protein